MRGGGEAYPTGQGLRWFDAGPMPPPLPPGGPGALPAPHNHAPSDPRPWHPAGQGLGQRVRDGSSEYFTVIAGRQYSFVTWAYDEYNNRQTSGSPGFRMNAGACLGCTLGGAETDRRQPGVQDGCGCVPGRSVTIWAFGGGGGALRHRAPAGLCLLWQAPGRHLSAHAARSQPAVLRRMPIALRLPLQLSAPRLSPSAAPTPGTAPPSSPTT